MDHRFKYIDKMYMAVVAEILENPMRDTKNMLTKALVALESNDPKRMLEIRKQLINRRKLQ